LKNRCLLLACLLSTVAIAGCGDGGGSSDEAAVEATIEAALLEKDPGKCTELYTAAFREQTTNKTGSAAIEDCEDTDDPNDRAKSIEISNLAVDDATATADVAISGGSFSGQTITVALVEDGDGWKLDAVTRFAKLDVDKLAAMLERQAEAEGGPSAVDRCFIEKLKSASQAEIEDITMSQSGEARAAELAESCAPEAAEDERERVAPRRSRYSYLVPSGFGTTAVDEKLESDAAFPTAVGSPAADHPGAGIAVAEIPSLPPVESASDLRDVIPFLETEIAALQRATGADSRETGVAKLPGLLALRWELLGGRFGPFPGTDVEAFVIYTATGGGVTVACRWGREAGEREAIQRGCRSVLDSLEVD
jgi:hypothetical protein